MHFFFISFATLLISWPNVKSQTPSNQVFQSRKLWHLWWVSSSAFGPDVTLWLGTGESFWSFLVFNHTSNTTDCQLPLHVLLSTSHATIWDKHFKWEVIWNQFGWFTWQTTDYSRFQFVGFPIEDQIFILISLTMPHQVGAYALKWRWWVWWPSVLALQKPFYRRFVLVAPHCSFCNGVGSLQAHRQRSYLLQYPGN